MTIRRESPDRVLLRAFLADLMGTALLSYCTWTGSGWNFDDQILRECSASDLALVRRARKLLGLKPLVLRVGPDKPNWYDRAGDVAEAWANGKKITRAGEIRP